MTRWLLLLPLLLSFAGPEVRAAGPDPNRVMMSFCGTRAAVETVARHFADGEKELAREVFFSLPDCFAPGRVVQADESHEVVGLVTGSAGSREILKNRLRGRVIFTWRKPQGSSI